MKQDTGGEKRIVYRVGQHEILCDGKKHWLGCLEKDQLLVEIDGKYGKCWCRNGAQQRKEE